VRPSDLVNGDETLRAAVIAEGLCVVGTAVTRRHKGADTSDPAS
jgi:hypothetical protein